MTKFKIQDSVWHVLAKGLKLYFFNIAKFTQYMLFPVFGQILGIVLIFFLVGWFNSSLPFLLQRYSVFNNLLVISIVLVILTIPGIALFLKAFWDFLVAYGALNSMTDAIISNGKLYDFKAHNDVVTRHSIKYIGLLFVISLLSLIALNPLFWVLGLIFFVYFILVFQVFALEEGTSIIGCFKKSFYLVKGNFGRTFLLMAVLGLISHCFLTLIFSGILDFIKLSEFFKGIFESWAHSLPLVEVNKTLSYFRLQQITELKIANDILSSLILFIVTGLTLPMRSVCWCVWYKNLICVNENSSARKK